VIDKVNYIYQTLEKIKFPPFLINGKEYSIGYCEIVGRGDGHLALNNDETGKFICFYHVLSPTDEIGEHINRLQRNKATGMFIHKQFLVDDFTEDQMRFILQDGGYKCNLGVIEIYTSACVAGVNQYRDDIIF
jgi:hypothetical protein